MSRKHYREAAAAIAELVDRSNHQVCSPAHAQQQHDDAIFMARELAAMFKRGNPRFDRDRFYRACGLPELAAN